jgi:membrane protein
MTAKGVFNLLRATFQKWSDDAAARLGAALAYYTVFSLAPMLIIIISVAGLVLGPKAVSGQISADIGGIVGKDSANLIQSMIQSSSQSRTGIIGTVIGLVTLFLGAVGLVGQLRDSLDIVWGAPKPQAGIARVILGYVFSFVVVLAVAALLIASAALTAIVGWLGGFLNGIVPGLSTMVSVANLVVSTGLIILLFALIYKILPNVTIAWNDVWIGAIVTALLFTLGRFAIGFYLGHSNVGSGYGAAGSLVVVLLWAYYSGQIILFGAEFTEVYARQYGSRHELARRRELEAAEAAARARPSALLPRLRADLSATLTPRFLGAALLSLAIGGFTLLESWTRRRHAVG